ncbi:MAG: LPS assembly protein LptD [Gammaproteobacteria bacterium]|nr:LPS assembly protein LptD [Gammaproteobacteria bacterium]
MPKKNSQKLMNSILFSLTTVCLLTPWFATTAQTTVGGAKIGFADARICKPDVINVPAAIRQATAGPISELPTQIEADEIEVEDGTQLAILTGNAQILQGNRGVYADRMTYDQSAYKADAQGNVRFYTPNGDEILAESLSFEVDTFIGEAQGVKIKIADTSPQYQSRRHSNFYESYSMFAPFRTPRVTPQAQTVQGNEVYARARATAAKVTFEGQDYEKMTDVSMSTCVEGNNDVLLVAKQIELDHVEGIGRAKSMKVKFKGVPIFYFPSVTFPINDERKTGFLFPGIGYEKESGYIVEVPYYINISPQQDATVIPRVLSHRGVQLFGEYRYLTNTGRGEIKVEVLPSDSVFGDENRYAGGFKHHQNFNNNWRAKIDIQTVSDVSYLRDFANDVDIASASYVPQTAQAVYSSDLVRFEAKASSYETVNTDIASGNRPYETLPKIAFNIKPQKVGALKVGLDSEYVDYHHDDQTKVNGSRLRIKPYVGIPLEAVYGYLRPEISLQTISYSLTNQTGSDSSPSVSVPVASVDSGLFFERTFKRSDKNYLQTLEPRLFYLNIPEKSEQELFPAFDTGLGSNTSIEHYFRENRFFGGDRIGDTHQLSLGLTSRVIDDDSGAEKFNLKLGQVYYLDDREVGLSETSAKETTSRSDFLFETTANLNLDWKVSGFARWSEETNDVAYTRLSASYDHSNRRRAALSYITNKGIDEQVNLYASTPLGHKWQLDTRSDYSLKDSEIRAAEVGLSYDGCCWAVRFGAQRYLDGNNVYDNRYMFTFELDDLGRIGSQL